MVLWGFMNDCLFVSVNHELILTFAWKGKGTKVTYMILKQMNKLEDSHYLFSKLTKSYSIQDVVSMKEQTGQ